MDPYSEIVAFAREHRDEDPLKLLLQQRRYPSVDLKRVAQQLEGQRQASVKWPTLARCTDYCYPPKLNREQSSSEAAARYKAQLFRQLGGGTFADLTGGMGVDTFFMAQEASQADYFEISPDLCALARRNFEVLGQDNITCRPGDSIALLEAGDAHYDLLLVDPARRDSQGRKVAAFEDCSPNLLAHLDLLRSRCCHLLVKASPMIDLRQALQQLGAVSQVHIVALHNECKEVLFLLAAGATAADPTIHCVQLLGAAADSCCFLPSEEAAARPTFASRVGRYLYEPHAALMKGGAFNLVSQRYGLDKLARNTHLYTSDRCLADFPGRCFEVLTEVPLNAKRVAPLVPEGKVHILSRNHPLSPDQLHHKLRLPEGGSLFLIAATLATTPRCWLCRQLPGA